MAKAKTTKKKNAAQGEQKHIRTFWKLFGGLIVLVLLVFLLASWGVFGSLPDETRIWQLRSLVLMG